MRSLAFIFRSMILLANNNQIDPHRMRIFVFLPVKDAADSFGRAVMQTDTAAM